MSQPRVVTVTDSETDSAEADVGLLHTASLDLPPQISSLPQPEVVTETHPSTLNIPHIPSSSSSSSCNTFAGGNIHPSSHHFAYDVVVDIPNETISPHSHSHSSPSSGPSTFRGDSHLTPTSPVHETKHPPPDIRISIDGAPETEKPGESTPLISPASLRKQKTASQSSSGATETSPEVLPVYVDIESQKPTVDQTDQAQTPPNYYPPRPRTPLEIALTIILFPFYIIYKAPGWLWTHVVVKTFEALKAGCVMVATGVWEWIVKPVCQAVAFVVKGVWEWVVWPVLWGVGKVFEGIWWCLSKVGEGIYFSIAWIATMVWKGIISPIITAITATAKFIHQYIVMPIINGVVWVATGIWNWIVMPIGKGVWSGFVAITTAVKWVVVSIWTYIVVPIGKAIAFIITSIANAIVWILCAIRDWVLIPIGKGIAFIVTSIWKGIVVIVTSIWKGVVAVATAFWTWIIVPIGKAIWWILTGIGWCLKKGWEGCAWLASTISYILTRYLFIPIWKGICYVGKGVWTGICVVFKTIWTGLTFLGRTVRTYILHPIRDLMAFVGSTMRDYVFVPLRDAIRVCARAVRDAGKAIGAAVACAGRDVKEFLSRLF